LARRGARERVEPRFEEAPQEQPEAEDRPSPRKRRAKAARDEEPEDDHDDAPAPRPKPKAKKKKKAAKKRGKGGGDDGKGKGRFTFGRAVYWGAVLSLWLVIAGVGTLAWIGMHLPPLQSLEIPKRPPTINIVGIDGKTLATRGNMGGAAVPVEELPPYVPKAFIAIEDRRFYSHYGVDPIGLARAVVANVLHRGVTQGGSTLTQQLAKNLFLTQQRTMGRKLQEVVLALWLEHKFTKAQILDIYLNRVYFGAGAYGIEAAAQRYFGKSARQMTLSEAAMLAGIVKSPSRLAPTHNFAGAQKRAQLVLAAMSDAKLVKDTDTKLAMTKPPVIVKQTTGGAVNYVADYVMDALNELVGRVEEDVVVDTTVDAGLQAAAEKALTDEMNLKANKFDVEQAAMVSMSPDGALRALVGGRSYAESQFNRAVAAKRQPGSAFKPFVYLTAIERGLTPDTVREDKPIAVKGWKPENYSHEYFGKVTLTQALAMSLNTVSVRLTMEFGPTAVARTAYRLGISSKLEPNASIALGTSEVSPLELVSAYVPFSNGGFAITPHVIERVRTADGKVLYTRTDTALGRVIEPEYVGMMNHMMRETLIIGSAKRADLPGWPAAGKTGTSQDFRDAWFIGYTSHLITGVWIGNDDSTPTKKATGSGLPVDIWSKFMKAAHQGVPVADLPRGNEGSGPLASIFGSNQESQPQAQPVRAQQPAKRDDMDGWLIDKLFSRR
jgi:penicillin-binding protein 1A